MFKKKTVFVGLSGGVDSSVAALRLRKQNYNVVGVFIKVWHPDFMVCNWEQERLDAMRVAAHLDIPFLTCDAVEAYKKEVADYFIAEYLAGRTPNPDVMCNQSVKFGAFLRFAMEKEADYVATGHYAQKISNEMHRGVDANKDQTYFLWTLTNEQLSKVLFPVGNTPKEQIRKEAAKANIPTAAKKDSQGICFLGHVDIPEFLSHFTDLQAGDVLDENNEVIGRHQGALVYTIGQRHGFTIDTHNTHREHMFVVAKDISNNTITVSSQQPKTTASESIRLDRSVLRKELQEGETIEVQFRYRQVPVSATVQNINDSSLEIVVAEGTDVPATGQSAVIYQNTHCIGGGVVA